VVPLQDTPRIRITWSAELEIPRALRAVMSARAVERREDGDRAFERFEMPQPIPPYLFALAVGDLASRDLGPRSRVWAEPSVVEKAAWEFEATDRMLSAAEKLFGPYDWERFDLLVMPPSFPYGGMENPRLTFLTPTLMAGDRSLVNVVAHELAHSWTGNLVTNANAEHFWLNEGFTVYAERRIQEVLEGQEMAALHAALGRRSLESAVEGFAQRPELTRLRTHLTGVDPDDAYSQVPYEKGYLFLRALEEAAGREAFDHFLKRYIETFRFKSITTDSFLELAQRELPAGMARVDVKAWLDGEGIPENAPRAVSNRLKQVEALGAHAPAAALARTWTPTEWQLYLESVSRPASRELCDQLESDWNLTRSTNMEVLVAWLELALDSGMDVVARSEEVLGSVGRMKYLRPLYTALARRDDTRADARRIFSSFSPRYHPIARQVVDGVLRRNGA
jgi:aminopeptidase N